MVGKTVPHRYRLDAEWHNIKMKIEAVSLKFVTVAIFSMLGVIAIVLSIAAGTYFKQAALTAQGNSLSRVIEIASQEVLSEIENHTFELGMKLGHNKELIAALQGQSGPSPQKLVKLLNDPFINGFVAFARIDLVKLRVFDLDLQLVSESGSGISLVDKRLASNLLTQITERSGSERLKSVSALWISPERPLFSTIVPIGGLRAIGYLEVIADPLFNLPGVQDIIKTPVSIYAIGENQPPLGRDEKIEGKLPVRYILRTSDNTPIFAIIGYENISDLNREIEETQLVTTVGYLALTITALLFALWLFNKFLLSPVSRMTTDMDKISHGKLGLTISSRGLREFHILANAFNAMTEQVRIRTNDLERLLDLDDNALLCFDQDNEAIYFNAGAASLFGYNSHEISDLDLSDLFVNDIGLLLKSGGIGGSSDAADPATVFEQLTCKHKDGHLFEANASIAAIDIMQKDGLAITIKTQLPTDKEDKRLHAVEQSIGHLLTLAKSHPNLISHPAALPELTMNGDSPEDQKLALRRQVVKVMNLALVCWNQVTGKSKIDLAEESRIWPVYMDKSTPTTRTLDKYLNVERCPKHPRHQRVIDTAEFVLSRDNPGNDTECRELRAALQAYRQLISGIK